MYFSNVSIYLFILVRNFLFTYQFSVEWWRDFCSVFVFCMIWWVEGWTEYFDLVIGRFFLNEELEGPSNQFEIEKIDLQPFNMQRSSLNPSTLKHHLDVRMICDCRPQPEWVADNASSKDLVEVIIEFYNLVYSIIIWKRKPLEKKNMILLVLEVISLG